VIGLTSCDLLKRSQKDPIWEARDLLSVVAAINHRAQGIRRGLRAHQRHHLPRCSSFFVMAGKRRRSSVVNFLQRQKQRRMEKEQADEAAAREAATAKAQTTTASPAHDDSIVEFSPEKSQTAEGKPANAATVTPATDHQSKDKPVETTHNPEELLIISPVSAVQEIAALVQQQQAVMERFIIDWCRLQQEQRQILARECAKLEEMHERNAEEPEEESVTPQKKVEESIDPKRKEDENEEEEEREEPPPAAQQESVSEIVNEAPSQESIDDDETILTYTKPPRKKKPQSGVEKPQSRPVPRVEESDAKEAPNPANHDDDDEETVVTLAKPKQARRKDDDKKEKPTSTKPETNQETETLDAPSQASVDDDETVASLPKTRRKPLRPHTPNQSVAKRVTRSASKQQKKELTTTRETSRHFAEATPNTSRQTSLQEHLPADHQQQQAIENPYETRTRKTDGVWLTNRPYRKFLKEMTIPDSYCRPVQASNNTNNTASTNRQRPQDLWDDSQHPYAYQEVVRNKAQRQCLPGHDCPECRKFYEVTADEQDEDPIQTMGRHRARYAPSNTPADFWELDFPDEREQK